MVNYTLINMHILIFTFGFHNVHLSTSSGMQYEDSAPFTFKTFCIRLNEADHMRFSFKFTQSKHFSFIDRNYNNADHNSKIVTIKSDITFGPFLSAKIHKSLIMSLCTLQKVQ